MQTVMTQRPIFLQMHQRFLMMESIKTVIQVLLMMLMVMTVSDGDCDDADPDRSPGATDIPDDGSIKIVMVDATEETNSVQNPE